MNIGIYTSNVDTSDTGPGIYRENLVRTLHDIIEPNDRIYMIHFEESSNDIYNSGDEILIHDPFWLSKIANLLSLDMNWGRSNHLTADKQVADNHNLDILHLQNIPYKRPFWLWDIDIPIVTTLHFGIRRFIHPNYYSFLDREKVKIAYKLISNKIDAFITVTEESKRLHSKYLNIDPEKIYVTHNAAPENMSPETDRSVLSKYNISDKYIFHLSNKNYYKNLEGIIKGYEQSIKENKLDHDLVIAGGRWEREDIDILVEDPSTLNRIHFLGYVPREDLPALYTHSTFFFLPSLSEAFPFVLLESMSCGTPIVTTGRYGMQEICGDAGIYIDDPHNINEIASVLQEAVEEAPRLGKMSLHQSKKFSWEKTAKETYKIYEDIVN